MNGCAYQKLVKNVHIVVIHKSGKCPQTTQMSINSGMDKYIWVIVRSKSVSSSAAEILIPTGSLCGAHPWILCQRHLSLIYYA